MNLEYLTRIGLSILLGILVGWEREGQNKTAGFRDISLVYLGATLLGILALELGNLPLILKSNIRYDIGRIFAYSVVSIGFLGSGVIIQYKDKLEGITTAVTLWVSLVSGLFCGLGNYYLAIVSAIAIYAVLKLKYIKIKIENVKKKSVKKKRRKG
ncbi:hypothetical protein LCGC14_1837180 [marine sediment metagenome]|uniref:MgtC/SapB/SrpB/YhiD N-terminal domain-containing protein n=1 Tax=marine sediment metagenome TaxID=412755 RepID=A0A0F9H2F9_9ZZZZ